MFVPATGAQYTPMGESPPSEKELHARIREVGRLARRIRLSCHSIGSCLCIVGLVALFCNNAASVWSAMYFLTWVSGCWLVLFGRAIGRLYRRDQERQISVALRRTPAGRRKSILEPLRYDDNADVEGIVEALWGMVPSDKGDVIPVEPGAESERGALVPVDDV